MSACLCGYAESIGSCILGGGPRIARKAGRVCPNCNQPVLPGQRCVDHAGLNCDGEGFFGRFHVECFQLMELFANKMCGGAWSWPFDIEDAARHAMANSDLPYWRDWLFLYEQSPAWQMGDPDEQD